MSAKVSKHPKAFDYEITSNATNSPNETPSTDSNTASEINLSEEMIQSYKNLEVEWLRLDNRIAQSLKDQYECITMCTEVTSGKVDAFIAPAERGSLKKQCQETKDWIKSQQDLCNRNKDKSVFPFS